MDIAEIAAVVRSGRTENNYDFDMKVFTKVREHMHENGHDTKSTAPMPSWWPRSC